MSDVRRLTYQPANEGSGAVEVLSFDRLRHLNHGGTQRGDFHVIAIVDTGRGSVTIDFASHPLSAGTAVWVPPGAVHRWDDIAAVAGDLVLFVPTAPVTESTRQIAAAHNVASVWGIADETGPYIDAARAHLRLESNHTDPSPPLELRQILLSALIARLQPPRTAPTSENPTFALFRSSVEAHFRAHHDVGYYAGTLGFVPRTLTRAAQHATGDTAKAFITARIALEAKRLLAHDHFPAARVATELGFPDPSNFSLFFRSATGTSPGAWRKQMQ